MKLYLGTIRHEEGFFGASHGRQRSCQDGRWSIEVQYEVEGSEAKRITTIYAESENEQEAKHIAIKQLKEQGYTGKLRLVTITLKELQDNWEWHYERDLPDNPGRLALLKGLN